MDETNSTVITSEITHFNNSSDNWWTMFPRLQKQNEIRTPEIIKSLVETGRISRETAESEKPLIGIKILDVGCGGGFASERLAKLGAQVTGLDACEKLIACAKEHLQDQPDIKDKVVYVHGTIEEFVEQNSDVYDHVTAAEILEHVQARDLFIKSCVKTLKPGGTLFMSTINRTIKAWLKKILYYEYIVGCIPRGTHHWSLLVTPEEAKSLIEDANCTILKFTGWCTDSTGHWQQINNTSVSYYMVAMKKY